MKLTGRKHLSFVLQAIEAKRHPESADLVATIQAGNATKPVLDYITMLNEGRDFVGRPAVTRTDKKLAKLEGRAFIYREIYNAKRNGNTISISEAIERVSRKQIRGFSKRKLWEYWKG